MEESSSLISNLNYFVSSRTKFLMMSLLLLLNLVMRLPSTPHEQGYDSFFIHSLANSITTYGHANWWTHWLSVFGLYPYSYGSAVPFPLSGISQITGIPMEFTILIYCILLGVFTIFTSYLLASVFYTSFISRFLFSFLFSLSAATMTLTTWQLTTRAQFLVFFPFFVYQTYKILNGDKKFIILSVLTFIFVYATHHYANFLIAFSILIFMTFLLHRVGSKIQVSYSKYLNVNYLYLVITLSLFVIPFLFSGKVGLIEYGSRYSWVISMIITSIRNLGPVFPLSLGGFVYLSLKKFKSYQEWSILLCILPTIVFSFDPVYGYLINYLLLIIMGVEGVINIVRNYKKDRKFLLSFLVLLLLLVVTFSCFFAHWKLGTQGGYDDWYMQENTYVTGQWIKDSLNPNAIGFFDGFEADRMYASYGGTPVVYGLNSILNYINGFIAFNNSDLIENSIYSKEFYFEGAYFLKNDIDSTGLISWLSELTVTDPRTIGFLKGTNISFFIEDKNMQSVFTSSLASNKDKICDVGRMRVWLI